MPGSDEVRYRTANLSQMVSAKLTRNGVVESELSHDGRRVLVNYSSSGAQNRIARIILNWTALMRM